MRSQITVLVLVVVGFGCTGDEQPDAGAPDKGPKCDPMGTFDAPVSLIGSNNAPVVGGSPRLTADELEMYIALRDPDSIDFYNDIYKLQRNSINQPFGASIALIAVNTGYGESSPSVSSDGLMLFFDFDDGETHTHMSTRISRSEEFGAPSELPYVNVSGDNNYFSFVTADGHELWFASSRDGGVGSIDIYRSVSNGPGFTITEDIAVLNSNDVEYSPVLSADRLTIYFSSSRPGSKGDYDIWTSHRNTTGDEFPIPRLVPELNSSFGDFPGWLSPDNCRLYLNSGLAAGISVATRHPR